MKVMLKIKRNKLEIKCRLILNGIIAYYFDVTVHLKIRDEK